MCVFRGFYHNISQGALSLFLYPSLPPSLSLSVSCTVSLPPHVFLLLSFCALGSPTLASSIRSLRPHPRCGLCLCLLLCVRAHRWICKVMHSWKREIWACKCFPNKTWCAAENARWRAFGSISSSSFRGDSFYSALFDDDMVMKMFISADDSALLFDLGCVFLDFSAYQFSTLMVLLLILFFNLFKRKNWAN